jgi:hypothetical protein
VIEDHLILGPGVLAFAQLGAESLLGIDRHGDLLRLAS